MKPASRTVLAAALALFACGCSTTERTTESFYDTSGRITKTIRTERDVSDFSAFLASSENSATTLSASLDKFSIGYNGWGLNWFSITGVRVKSPVKADGCSGAEALGETANIVSATKATLKTDFVSVNGAKDAQ